MIDLLQLHKYFILNHLKEGDVAVDFTMGNGYDTEFLSRTVGESGRVYAFDIQEKAIRLTGERLREQGIANVQLAGESFTSMREAVPEGTASAVVFNLGYLPGGDHGITTTAGETLEGLACALDTIRPGGIVTVVLYDGHEAGAIEKRRVLEWAEALDAKQYHVVFADMLNQKNHPPEILWITKK
jgi:predicted methyltransferase